MSDLALPRTYALVMIPFNAVHLKDGWTVVKAIRNYTHDDTENANCAAVVQRVNPSCPPPPEFALR